MIPPFFGGVFYWVVFVSFYIKVSDEAALLKEKS